MYKQCLEILKNLPYVSKYFTPVLELPEEVNNRLNQLTVKLFPFQLDFLKSYYNAKHKLGMDGMILSYSAGGGKTYTCIAAMYSFNIYPAIITAPRSTLDGWKASILKMIPGIKENEVKIISGYNPNKDKTKWKFLICNYERLEQAEEYSKYAFDKVKCIACDECHNFRNLTTNRSQMLSKLKKDLNINNVIAISATPIKALGSELIVIMKLLDPEFTDDAQKIFKTIYSRNQYDAITGSVLKNRLSIYLERKNLEESMKLPPKEMYNIEVTLNNPKPYLLTTMKDNIWKYVQEHVEEYKKEAQPNLNNLEKLLSDKFFTKNFDKTDIDSYLSAITEKMNNPFNKDLNIIINNFELEQVKKLDKNYYKKMIQYRKKITSYMMMLIGKALGIYFIKQKIKLLAEMVKENINSISDIIKNGEQKTVIFCTFIEPLFSVKEELEKSGINCILHTGQDDFSETLEKFASDKVKVLLGTISSIGTGSDGMQFYANQIIMLNRPYRDADQVQVNARVHRKGSTAKVVKIFFMKLITDEPNILDSEDQIQSWSREMMKLAY